MNISSSRRWLSSTKVWGSFGSRDLAYSHKAISTGPSRLLHRTIIWMARSLSTKSVRVTRIRPSVRVPVLSVQMTLTEPKVSTANSFLTKPWRLRILRIPRTKITVTAINKPSGIAEIAKITEVRSISRKSRFSKSPTRNIIVVNETTIIVNVLLKDLSRTCNGVSSSLCS
ncbi:MAG: hypothetical protein BWX60_00878 [Candidatus Marinimicrobia bacterium ADurb.Bin030]|nr:MAG: hypothetical protein BWX60_00878 [Candidatus Marinimicrobia bacterium ADurb.Bin030]